MGIKEFLKPDWRKIIISLFLLAITYFFPFLPFYFNYCPPCPGPIPCVPCPPSGIRLAKLEEVGFYINLWSSNVFFLLTELFTFYILSCLIVWIYDKVKKK